MTHMILPWKSKNMAQIAAKLHFPFNSRLNNKTIVDSNCKRGKSLKFPIPLHRVIYLFNSLPDNKILGWSKLKQIADDILKCI